MPFTSSVADAVNATPGTQGDAQVLATEHATPTYMPQLDGLRTLAVALVIWQHTGTGFLLLLHYQGIGAYGVWLFFVLSGFLITRILLGVRSDAPGSLGRDLRVFYARRFLRIFPAYYLALFVAFLMGLETVRQLAPWYLTYTFNWYEAVHQPWQHNVLAHVWSLCVEEQFYLVWPLIVLTMRRRHLHMLLILVLCITPLTRYALWISSHNDITVYIVTSSSFDCLGGGALPALGWHIYGTRGKECEMWVSRAGVLGFATLAILLLVPAIRNSHALQSVFAPSGTALASIWLVHRAALGFGGLIGKVPAAHPVTYIGRISYGVYLYHGFLLYAIPYTPHPTAGIIAARFIVLSVVSTAVAALSWICFEKPLNDLKRYVRYPVRPCEAAHQQGFQRPHQS